MKKNLLFAGLVYAVGTVALMIYLSIMVSGNISEDESIIGIFYVAGSVLLCFGLSFLSYLLYFLKQIKVVEESAYVEYLGIGIRVQLGLLVSAITGILLCLSLIYFYSGAKEYLSGMLEIVLPVVALVAINMVCFLTLKPRP